MHLKLKKKTCGDASGKLIAECYKFWWNRNTETKILVENEDKRRKIKKGHCYIKQESEHSFGKRTNI